MYAIVDIETTGVKPGGDRITEIAVVLFDEKKIVDSYQSLVNPECSIPPNITQITGITNQMVADAPKFYEIAKAVVEITKGAIFVAHNVGFDYGFGFDKNLPAGSKWSEYGQFNFIIGFEPD